MFCRLANQLMNATEAAAEPWLAMGYYSLETKKAARALYFAHKVRVASLTADPGISALNPSSAT